VLFQQPLWVVFSDLLPGHEFAASSSSAGKKKEQILNFLSILLVSKLRQPNVNVQRIPSLGFGLQDLGFQN
jgi:hypothetical protein